MFSLFVLCEVGVFGGVALSEGSRLPLYIGSIGSGNFSWDNSFFEI